VYSLWARWPLPFLPPDIVKALKIEIVKLCGKICAYMVHSSFMYGIRCRPVLQSLYWLHTHTHTIVYGPFPGTTRVSWRQKRTSGLDGVGGG